MAADPALNKPCNEKTKELATQGVLLSFSTTAKVDEINFLLYA